MAVNEGSSYLPAYLLMQERIHSPTLPPLPSLSFSQEGAPNLLFNPRTPPMQHQAIQPTQTDSPVLEAQYWEDNHDYEGQCAILCITIFLAKKVKNVRLRPSGCRMKMEGIGLWVKNVGIQFRVKIVGWRIESEEWRYSVLTCSIASVCCGQESPMRVLQTRVWLIVLVVVKVSPRFVLGWEFDNTIC